VTEKKLDAKSGLCKVTGAEENETQEIKEGTTESQATAIYDVQEDEELEETQDLNQPLAQEMNDDEEPIEWPDSPPPQSEVD